MKGLHDIVDRADHVIGQATADEAMDRNLIIRVAHNWIVNDKGQYLLQFRATHKRSMPRRFDASVGGKVDAGETYDQAVIRETSEELGINVTPVYAGKFFFDMPGEYKFVAVYYSFSNGPFTNWQDEAEALEWMSFDEHQALYQRFPYLFCGNESLPIAHEAILKRNPGCAAGKVV